MMPQERRPKSAEELVEGLDRKALEPFADRMLAEVPANEIPILHSWLRHLVSDSSLARQHWSALEKLRDPYVFRFWKRQEPNLKSYVEERWCSWSYYEKYMFEWFLGRFDLSAAREVFEGSSFPRFLPGLLVVVVVSVSAYTLRWFSPGRSSLVLLGLFALFGLLAWKSQHWFKLPTYAFVNSLIPRLAAAVGAGYLFLAAAPQIVHVIYASSRPWWHYALITLGLLASAFLYLLFHVSRRVYPALRPRDLCRRSAAVLSLAIAYASAGLLVAGPLLFSRSLLGIADGRGVFPKDHVHWYHLALCAAVALNLGVILQLAWDEKPLTEPL